MKLNKLFAILIVVFLSAFLIAGCGNDKSIDTSNMKVETDENDATSSVTVQNDNKNTQTEMNEDFEDNSIDSDVELGELI